MSGDSALQGDALPELMRFADALLSEGKSLLVARSDTQALNLIGQSLQTIWQKRAPQLKVEHFSGRLSVGLLGLVNATLADQALSSVMQGNTHQPPRHLCVVHDAECLSQDELRLLQRVIEHFPGWHTRLLLLFKTALDTSEKLELLLQQPDKGLVIWQLPQPPEQLASSGPTHGLKPWLMGLSSLLVLGAVVIWLRPPTHLPGKPDDSATERATPTLLPASAPADSAPAQADAMPVAPPASDQASAPPSVSASAPAQDTAPALPPVPDVAARGQRWLSAQPKDFFVLIHSSHERLLQAQRTIESKPELSNARLIMLSTASTEPAQFVVVTGPFRSEERAQNYKTRQKLPATARIELVGSVLQKSRAGPKVRP